MYLLTSSGAAPRMGGGAADSASAERLRTTLPRRSTKIKLSAPLLQVPAAFQVLDHLTCRPLHEPKVALPKPRIGRVAHAA